MSVSFSWRYSIIYSCLCTKLFLYIIVEHIFSILKILYYGLKIRYLLIVYFFVSKLLHGWFIDEQHLDCCLHLQIKDLSQF